MIKNKLFILLHVLLILSFFSNIVSSDSPPTVYILNSDRLVEKLSLSEINFKKHFSGKLKSFDLKELEKKKKNIKKIFKPAKQDLIYCIGSRALSFVLKTYPKNRIIFSSVINWRRFDISELSYGISGEIPVETQLTLFKLVFPSIKKIGIVYSPEYNQEWFDEALSNEKAFNLKLVGIPYKGAKPVDKIFANLFPLVDAVWLIPDPGVITRNTFLKIIMKSDEMKKPILTYNDAFVENGAVMSISIDSRTAGNQAAVLAERIINGEKIKGKIQNPAGSFITLNMKKVKEFKLKMNPEALGSINRIIE